jgi:hypothetical protein
LVELARKSGRSDPTIQSPLKKALRLLGTNQLVFLGRHLQNRFRHHHHQLWNGRRANGHRGSVFLCMAALHLRCMVSMLTTMVPPSVLFQAGRRSQVYRASQA